MCICDVCHIYPGTGNGNLVLGKDRMGSEMQIRRETDKEEGRRRGMRRVRHKEHDSIKMEVTIFYKNHLEVSSIICCFLYR